MEDDLMQLERHKEGDLCKYYIPNPGSAAHLHVPIVYTYMDGLNLYTLHFI